MAMLGLFGLMAPQEVSEEEMCRVELQMSAYWFPQTYLALAKYFEGKETNWKDADAKLLLGKE